MTDQEKQEVSERAQLEGQALADVVIPRLRGEIWRASATWSAIAAFVLFSFYRSDFAALREDIKQIRGLAPSQVQQNQITVKQAEGLIERETRRLLEERKNDGNVRRVGDGDSDFAASFDR